MKMKLKEYYSEWIQSLKKQLLPQLEHALMRQRHQDERSVCLLPHVERLRESVESYYTTLERAASEDVLLVLCPTWRSTTQLEKPFLWLGDFHPALLINLFRALLTHHNDQSRGLASATDDLFTRIDRIEGVIGTMVPALFYRMRNVQMSIGTSLAKDWLIADAHGSNLRGVLGDGIEAQIGELREIFLDANRMRRNAVTEILSACDVHQAAHYLQGLAQFYVALADPHLASAL